MKLPKTPLNEAVRLGALEQYHILDTLPEEAYDNITKLAAYICDTPIALVSLVDKNRQYFKSHLGLDVTETPREYAFCAHAINMPDELMMVTDARVDDRFDDNPLVTGAPNVIFYAGYPLVTSEGYALGTLCVIDHKPKELNKVQKEALGYLANQVIQLLDLRKKKASLEIVKGSLTRNAHRLSNIIEGTNVGTWEWNVQTGKTVFNDRWAEMIGYTLEELEPVSIQTWIKFAHPEDLKISNQKLQECFDKQAEFYDVECRMQHKDGHWVWVHDRGKVFTWTDDGKPLMMFGTHTDITARKNTETQLKAVTDNIAGVVYQYRLKPDGTNSLHHVSKGAETIWGYTGKEAEENTHLVFNRYQPDDMDEYLQSIQASAANLTTWIFESRYHHPDGTVKWQRGRGVPHHLPDGSVVWDSFVVDITAEKKAAELVEHNQHRFQSLVENISDVIMVFDEQGHVSFVSPSCKKVLGYTPEEIQAFENFDITHKDDLEECAKRIRQCVENPGVAIEGYPCRLLHKNGEWIHVESTLISKINDSSINGIVTNFRDVTEKRRLEEKARRDYALMKEAEKISKTGSWELDLQTNKISWSDGVYLLCGYEPQEFEVDYQKGLSVIHPDDHEKAIAAMTKAIEQGVEYEVEKRFVRKDKQIRQILSKGSVIKDWQGKPAKLIGVFHDITDIKQASLELQLLMDNTDEAFLMLDLSLNIMKFNLRFGQLYKEFFQREVVAGSNILEHTLPNKREEAVKIYERVSQGFKEEAEVTLVSSKGVKTLFEVYYKPAMDNIGNVIGIFVSTIDVTEKRIALDLLRESEEHYRALFNQSPLPKWVYDTETFRFLDVNKAAIDHYGYSLKEFLSMNVKDIRPKEDIATFEKKANNGSTTFLGKGLNRHCKKNGDVIYVEVKTTPIEYRKINAKMVVAIDVTEKLIIEQNLMKSEEALRLLNTELEERVEQRTIDLVEANRQLEAFSYSISHDLQTPLRSIMGFTQLLKAQSGEQLSADSNAYLEHVIASSKKMGELIKNLLDFSRVGKREIKTTGISTTKLVEEIWLNLPKENSDKITFKLAELPDVMGDKAMLTQVFVNLLSNAVKYSSKKEHQLIQVSAELKGDEVHFHVSDNGAGFDMSHAHKLFGIFKRLHSANDFEGTGVGLSIVKLIVEKHGGTIWVDAKPGVGATFSFSLPY